VVTYAADDREGVYTIADLGPATVYEVSEGSQRWELRIHARSTVAGDEIDIDGVLLIPTKVYAEIEGVLRFQTPASFSALSTFDIEAGAITGDSATIGGAWAGAGDADDFSAGSGIATRTAVSDADVHTGRYAISGAAGFAAQVAQIDFKTNIGTTLLIQGVFARWVDVNNWLRAELVWSGGANVLIRVWKRVAGTPTIIAASRIWTAGVNTWYTIRLHVDAAGRYFVWWFPQGHPSAGDPVVTGQDAVLATGGTLASGKPGFYDALPVSNATSRDYDNFLAFAPTPDAAIFAGRSLKYAHDGAWRLDAGGTGWAKKTVEGRHLHIPCSGEDGSVQRCIIVPSQHDPDTMAHAFGDIRATLAVTERYL
jgi:hypothetical protein